MAEEFTSATNDMAPHYKSLIRVMLVAGAVVATAAADDNRDRRTRFRLGGITAGVTYFNGFGPWGYIPYSAFPYYGSWLGLYDPYWISPFLYSAPYAGFAQSADRGQVRMVAPRNAMVYVDDGFAGTSQKLKSIWLDPGVYQLKVVATSGQEYKKKIYVLSGKTLDINTELQ